MQMPGQVAPGAAAGVNPVAIPEARKQQSVRDLASIQRQLAEANKDAITRMPEAVFAQIFMPMFAGEDNPVYPDLATLENWVRCAGGQTGFGHFMPVDVIAPAGNVLFRVPPIFNRDVVNNERPRDQASMMNIVLTAQNYTNFSPQHGEAYLSAKLTERNLLMKVPANVLRDVEVWNAIFKRYGKPELMAIPKTDTPETPDNGGVEYEFSSDD